MEDMEMMALWTKRKMEALEAEKEAVIINWPNDWGAE